MTATRGASPDFMRRLEALRAEFMRAQDGQPTTFLFQFDEAQLLDMASGFVPASVQAAMMAALDWAEGDRRRAARPVPKPRKKAAR